MKKRVLIVDDSATVRADVARALASEYQCLEATDGLRGIEVAQSTLPDAMIVDLEMPVMDGLTMLQHIKADARTSAIPVIIVTTTTAVDRINQCRALGCASFVLKPVDGAYLVVKLRKLLQRKS